MFALSVHESAHAWTADRCGDDTARRLGRVTLNPWPHVDLFGTIIMPAIGLLSGLPVLGWAKPTPVNLTKLRHPRRDDILVTAAGPASNFLIALVALATLTVIRLSSGEGARVIADVISVQGADLESGSLITPVVLLLYRFLFVNVLLGVFNLIPIPPLDGGQILGQALPTRWQSLYAEFSRFSFVLLIGLLLMGIPYRLFAPVLRVFHQLLRF